MRPRLKVVLSPAARRDLHERRQWSEYQAQRVVDQMTQMAAEGWNLGRASVAYPGFRWWPVPPLGVLYRVAGTELRVARVFHAAQLQELP